MAATLDPRAVDAALRSLISDLDYDLHKQLERDEETGEDNYPIIVAKFINSYGNQAPS
jgi:hypothetical protein